MSRGLQPAEVPNSTQVPNVLFTQLLPELSSAELRAYMYICYHTFGYGKTADAISYEQFLRGQVTADGRILDRGCGIKNRTALSQALQTLQEKGLIVARHEHDGQGHRRASTFALVLSADDAPLAQAAGAPQYQNGYSGLSIKTGTQDASLSIKSGTQDGQSTETDTQARVSKSVLTVPSSNRVGSNSCVAGNKQTASSRGLASYTNNPGNQSARAEDSSNKQPARAREGQDYLSTQDITPDTSWLMPLARRIHKQWGGGATKEDLQTWCDPLSDHLSGCTAGERDVFVRYLFSNDVMTRTSSPRGVRTVLGQDAQLWLSQGKPPSKIALVTPAAKVPAHVQWEHDHAHNPKSGKIDANSPPEVIARIVAHLRKTGGDEKAQAWLRSIGLAEQGA